MLPRWTKVAVVVTTAGAASAASAASTSPLSFLPPGVSSSHLTTAGDTKAPPLDLFEDTLDALRVLQEAYFEPWVGTWPTAIDWTAAVMGSHVAGALHSLSKGLDSMQGDGVEDFKAKENLVSLYFSQLIGFYFGQDAFSLRNQAFDDMLWVVLGWLDTIKFVEEYSKTHYEATFSESSPTGFLHPQSWHGNLWSPAFAHRARIFWHLAAAGWDTKLCGGGMNWNPRLMPYKNAITNELFIAASSAMYLYFPGDTNTSPFGTEYEPSGSPKIADWQPHDPKYIGAAFQGYSWLVSSNMTNDQGLYADGFHISGYKPGSNHTECDERDEMVYTYNQGVLLSGQRGLYQVSGRVHYLRDGHKLIQNVIRATGWDLDNDFPVDDLDDLSPGQLPRWHGLGRAGVLEDACDVTAKCSQDAQTFKGIWMHHFTNFCAPLEPHANSKPSEAVMGAHVAACRRYTGWLQHNAVAAQGTRDRDGKFGMWWTVGLLSHVTQSNIQIVPGTLPSEDGAVDYRNDGIPNDPEWVAQPMVPQAEWAGNRSDRSDQRPLRRLPPTSRKKRDDASIYDLNDRGRGRTVETQSGGLAVLRALWELSKL